MELLNKLQPIWVAGKFLNDIFEIVNCLNSILWQSIPGIPVIPDELILKNIYHIRGQKVMLDFDLAKLYQVETKRLKEQVNRNKERFPEDFMFTLTVSEYKILRMQIATSSWGGTRYMPMAFTEQGVAMLSSILNSTTGIRVNIQIIRVFTLLAQVFPLLSKYF